MGGTGKTSGADSAQDRRRGHWGKTYDLLAGTFSRGEMVQQDDGTWPWVKVKTYAVGGTADSAGYRIRRGNIRLPDVDGGEDGRWDAWVQRKVKGKKGFNGPAELWVRYIGKTGEL